MRRRTFLQLSVGAAGGGVLPGARAAPPRLRVKAKVVVAGGGFAGANCAVSLRRLNPAIEVTLVDPDDRYVTCPMSNSVLATCGTGLLPLMRGFATRASPAAPCSRTIAW
jgi:hypothetical protein